MNSRSAALEESLKGTLEYIDRQVNELGFCLSSSVVKALKEKNRYSSVCSASTFIKSYVEPEWKKMYHGKNQGKITSCKEILDEIERKEKSIPGGLLLVSTKRHIIGKIRGNTKIFYYDMEKVIDTFSNWDRLEKFMYSLENV
jgi:hypothetical protein